MKTLSALLRTLIGLALVPLLALAAAAQTDAGYKLRAGDVLRIEVVEDASLNRATLIAPDGRISVPLAGPVQASGRTIEVVQADIIARLAPNFAAPPTVFLSIERLAEQVVATGITTIDVFVVGEAGRPGRLEIEPGTTVLQAFALMGGFTRFAATKRIQLRRGAETFALNYKAIEAGTSTAGSTVLAEGDVIVVPERRLFE